MFTRLLRKRPRLGGDMVVRSIVGTLPCLAGVVWILQGLSVAATECQ